MPNPFPGMNPYLESPANWRNFHQAFISEIYRSLNRLLPPEFAATMDERLYVSWYDKSFLPDVAILVHSPETGEPEGSTGNVAVLTRPEIRPVDEPLQVSALVQEEREWFVEIVSTQGNREVIAVIELLSPTNKAADTEGAEEYHRKQRDLLRSDIHLVEIDLLRGGPHTVAVPLSVLKQKGIRWDYLVCLHQGMDGANFRVWSFTVRDPLPHITIPLTDGVAPVSLDLQDVFTRTWDDGPFDRILQYEGQTDPALTPEDTAWVEELLRMAGKRL
jgi:hypothetical protein